MSMCVCGKYDIDTCDNVCMTTNDYQSHKVCFVNN